MTPLSTLSEWLTSVATSLTLLQPNNNNPDIISIATTHSPPHHHLGILLSFLQLQQSFDPIGTSPMILSLFYFFQHYHILSSLFIQLNSVVNYYHDFLLEPELSCPLFSVISGNSTTTLMKSNSACSTLVPVEKHPTVQNILNLWSLTYVGPVHSPCFLDNYFITYSSSNL